MIYFIRHGQTDWNLQKKIQGRIDIPLNQTGKLQAEKIREEISSVEFSAKFCSPLLRARQTFEIVFNEAPTNKEIDARLTERDFGICDGKTRDAFDFSRFWNISDPIIYDKAESLESLYGRVKSFIEDVNKIFIDKNIAIVSHGGVGFALASLYQQLPKGVPISSLEIPNGSYVTIDNNKRIDESKF